MGTVAVRLPADKGLAPLCGETENATPASERSFCAPNGVEF